MSDVARRAIELALRPGRFFVHGGTLSWTHQAQEQIRWEIFHGHLLDHRQTRSEAVFETWNVQFQQFGDAPPQNVVSLRLAGEPGPLYVTRELHVYGEEAYEPAPNVIATRPAQIAQRELVGKIGWQFFPNAQALAAEISHYVLLALVGTSRLPITSVESPLPAFSLGQLGYAPLERPHEVPSGEPIEWIERGLSPGPVDQQARVLELALRAVQPAEVPALGRAWQQQIRALGLGPNDTLRTVRAAFNQIALTPYTSLADNVLDFLRQLVDDGGIAEVQFVDLVGFLLRQLVRHLNAFDLVMFHNQGANYPDALLLESLLREYVSQIDRRPTWFVDRSADSADQQRVKGVRRRAVRGAWAIRLRYAGHLVPDLPTSPGENARVLAGVPHRVPEEQLLRPAARRRRLFDDGSPPSLPDSAEQILLQSIADLDDPRELVETGTALFLDRPLGLFHDAGYVDRTPLVSYEAFSRTVAAAQIERLCEAAEISAPRREHLAELVQRAPAAECPPIACRAGRARAW